MIERSQHWNLANKLLEAIRAIPGAEAVMGRFESSTDTHADFDIQASFSGHPVRMLVEAKTQVFPRDAHQIVRQLKPYVFAEPAGAPVIPMVAAKHISPGAREVLSKEGVGYFAEGGSLCVPATGLFIFVDKPAERNDSQYFDLFTEARTPVVHAMLLEPELPFTVQDLASRTGSSGSTVSKLMAHLERLDWIQSEGSGPFKRRRLSRPGAALDAWVEAASAGLPHRTERRFFVRGIKAVDMPRAFKERLPEQMVENKDAYQFTAEVAASQHAPYLTSWNTATVRAVPHFTEQMQEALGAEEVGQGHNLLVLEGMASALRFFDLFDGVVVASRVQTYVDLMCAPGRAPDAARFLREQALKF